MSQGDLHTAAVTPPAAISASKPNSPARVLVASLVGTTIEFYDFYIYATAAVIIFPRLFFPAADPASARLQSFATFALAFFARPIGSALFGHFGDRIGRKATLVAALLTMGLSTILIGVLPTYARIGILAPVLLAALRFGQGLGLGGEWGGAVLLATEHAPRGKQALYGMYPQLGAPLGFIFSSATFLLLTTLLNDTELFAWGWRIPFLASALLVFLGLYVRLRLAETPAFQRAVANNERVRVPMLAVWRDYPGTILVGTLAATTTFLSFYLMTVFSLSWGTTALGYPRTEFLLLQMAAVLMFALFIPVSALLADRCGRLEMLAVAAFALLLFGLVFAPLFSSGSPLRVLVYLSLGMALIGLTYGPLGTGLAELFRTSVRYTGASLTFNLAGILGASITPYVATALAKKYGLPYVGYYLSAASLMSLVALIAIRLRHRTD
ncbi:MAG: MFS transporter [Sinobacteraceae bacterium]|nr:MFS transporter [Nevskiaceae bacterium]